MALHMQDSENPKYLFRMTDTVLLSQLVKGQIDPIKLAERELANRGLNREGQWIGFYKAKKLFKTA